MMYNYRQCHQKMFYFNVETHKHRHLVFARKLFFEKRLLVTNIKDISFQQNIGKEMHALEASNIITS